MTVSAKIIKDSVTAEGVRLTTAELTMHRFVLAEFNTHRVFSRNSASSRAIPVEKQLAKVRTSPAFPIEWASEQPGMQGGSELTGIDLLDAQMLFGRVWDNTVTEIEQYLEGRPKEKRLHKSLLNRLLEPFMYHQVIVTSVDFQNFFEQRASEYSPLAQPEIKCVADWLMLEYRNSVPEHVGQGQWHLPYIQGYELADPHVGIETWKKVSAARCARVSYLTHDGKRDIEKDLELYERLVSAKPPHASPLEHVARPAEDWEYHLNEVKGNFAPHWVQLRHLVGVA